MHKSTQQESNLIGSGMPAVLYTLYICGLNENVWFLNFRNACNLREFYV